MGCSLYYIKLKIGAPSQEYFLDADTGSSLTWINCKFTKTEKCQKEVSSYQQLNHQLLIDTIILQFIQQFSMNIFALEEGVRVKHKETRKSRGV